MTYTLDFSVQLGPGKTGLSDLRAQLVDTGGANVGSAVSTGFTEIGTTGTYLWHYAAFPDSHRGGVKFYSLAASSTILAFAPINPEEAENVDAKVSSRSTYAGGDTAGTTTLLSRIASVLTITGCKVDVNDKTGFALTSGEHTNIATDTQTGLTSQGYTTTRAGYLDTLNGLVAAIWAAATRTLTAFGFTVNTNANATETAIQAKTDNLPASPAATSDIPSAATIATQVDTTLSGTHGAGLWDAAGIDAADIRAAIGLAAADLDSQLLRQRGLIGENQGMRNATYDGDGNLTACDLCLYDSAAHATTNDGVTGLIGKYSIANTFTGGLMTDSVESKVS